jgi:hypothetical protein
MRPFGLLLFLAACSSGSGAAIVTDTPSTTVVSSTAVVADTAADPELDREELRLPLSLYVVSEAGDVDNGLGTRRTSAEVETIAAEIGPIWSQASVAFDPVNVIEIEMPTDVLAEIAATGRTDAFFDQVGRTFDLPGAGAINGFYVRDAGGVNGFTPIASRVFFVADEPTVNDRRVSSHEIGHILALHHDPFDPDRLMFSGTNGETLTVEEQQVARYAAQGILDGVR